MGYSMTTDWLLLGTRSLAGGNLMIISTTFDIPGKSVSELLGPVMGNTVRSKNVGKDIGAGLKSIVGGELKSYTAMLTEAREEALNRMAAAAGQLGADAVVGVRYTTSAITEGAAELLAYGTAVKLS
jgi:uncharacterized protein YbjQ (UPF0145 family)